MFSLGGDREAGVRLRDRQEAEPLDRARLYVAGPVVTGDDPEELIAHIPDEARVRSFGYE